MSIFSQMHWTQKADTFSTQCLLLSQSQQFQILLLLLQYFIHGTQNQPTMYLWQILFFFSHLLFLGDYSRNKLLQNADLYTGSILAQFPSLAKRESGERIHKINLFCSIRDRQNFPPNLYCNTMCPQWGSFLGTLSSQKDIQRVPLLFFFTGNLVARREVCSYKDWFAALQAPSFDFL